MTDDSLNNPKDTGSIDNIMALFNCILEGRTAAYLSTPITTGRRFLEWYRETGHKLDPDDIRYKDEHYRAVIRPNTEEVEKKMNILRRHLDTVLVNPTKFDWTEWTQDDYRHFWGKVIENYADTVIFLDGWQYSSGCAFEFLTAVRSGAETWKEDRSKLDMETGYGLIKEAVEDYKQSAIPAAYLERVMDELAVDIAGENARKRGVYELPVDAVENLTSPSPEVPGDHFKDEVLNRLAKTGNVAQFVSFAADSELSQRFSRVAGFPPNYRFPSPEQAVRHLLENAPDGTVNVRSFLPGLAKGEPLHYGLDSVEKVMEIVRRKASENKITIVNETVDIHDGGVSGVVMGQILEFSPGDTPKCVDKPGVCRLPRALGLNLLEKVYGFRPAVNYPPVYRVEFSIHPGKRGIRHGHTIIWEIEHVNAPDTVPEIDWPDNFSRMLGDKAFGLLIADTIGLPVPLTVVITRTTAPFTFGRSTGTSETWIRTCPEARFPGKYPTYFGWRDPFKLIAEEELKQRENPEWVGIASVLSQQAVEPGFSGSLLPGGDGGKEPYIEGVRGRGDTFMLGGAPPETLPTEVENAVRDLYYTAFDRLGPVEMEWVYDGGKAWVVQLHKSRASTVGDVIYPGEPGDVVRFEVTDGLDALRKMISEIKDTSVGIVLVGDVGITSHFGDILRKAKIPSRIERNSLKEEEKV